MPPSSSKRVILIGIGSSLIVLACVTAWATWHVLTRALPVTRGELRVQGLAAPVDIIRDQVGVPHILAANDADLAFATGFVHAQDRLWQMDLLRRYGQGRLAEVLGARALPSDRLMRTIGIAHIADSLYRAISPLSRATLDAYARGVNAGMAEAKGRLPLEFDMLSYQPEPWTPQHSLIITRLMGWELALSWWVDLTLADLVQTVGDEKARELFPRDADDALPAAHVAPAGRSLVQQQKASASSAPHAVPHAAPREAPHGTPASGTQPGVPERGMRPGAGPRGAGTRPGARIDPAHLRALREAVLDVRALLGIDGSAIGSNAWAVTAARSASGRPILANDPHLPHMQPARWYMLHLSAPGVNVAGVSIPGTPGVIIGHTDRVAWGLTNLMTDDVDFSVEHVNFRDSTWEYRGAQRRMHVRTDSIFVRDSLPVVLFVYETAHGPLVQDVHATHRPPFERIRTTGISMRWTGRELTDEMLAVHRLDRARSADDVRNALRTFGVPGQNVVYADIDGRIGAQAAALVPMRSTAAAQMPSSGWEGAGEWSGFVPFEQLPRSDGTGAAFIASANCRPDAPTAYHLSALWESDARLRRIRQIIEEQRVFSAQDFRLMQMDMQSVEAGPVRDAMVRALARMPQRTVELTRAMNMLAQWDLRMTPSSQAAAIYNTAYEHLLIETFRDEMGPDLFRSFTFLSNLPVRAMPRLLADTSTTWFDNVHTFQVETRDDILRKSVLLGLLDLSRRLGTNASAWTWGALHTVTFRHPLGRVGPLGRILDVGPLAVGGTSTTINSGEYSFQHPYEAVVGPSMRMIVDLAAPDTCTLVITTGQSGQPMSRHYSDQAALWQNGAYPKLISNVSTVRSAGWETLTLTP